MSTTLIIPDEVTMAQLCLDTTAIVENNVYEIHVFADGSANETVFSANVGAKISATEFVTAFYGGSKGNSTFMAVADSASITPYYNLATDAKYDQHGVTDASGVDFTDEVMNIWKSETCTEWSTCSEMNIRKELVNVHNFKDLANCNVCCALTFTDLVAAINSAKANGAGNQIATDVVSGNKIALSILLKQSFPGTSDVEIIIHYQIA